MPRHARTALLGAAALLVLLVATWFAAFHIGPVERADSSILRGFGDIGGRPHVGALAGFIARLCNPNPYVYLCAIPLAGALLRRRLIVAVGIGAILLGANVTTELLKPLLATTHVYRVSAWWIAKDAWPSGHATAAMSLALCCVLAAPARLRPFVAAAGAAFAVAVSYSFLSLEWHYPSDVVGGFLIASIWTLLVIAAVMSADARRRAGADLSLTARPTIRQALTPPSAAVLAAIGLALLVVVARPHAVVAYAHLHKAFVIGAVAIAGSGIALATGVMLALRR